jgi:hypothetical protein
VENLVSGVDRLQDKRSTGVDAGALLNGIAEGQGTTQDQKPKPNTGNIGADLANQVAGGGSPSIEQIVGGLTAQGQGVAKNQSASQEGGQKGVSEQNNAKEQGAGLEKGAQQGTAQSSGGNGRVIQIEQTTITEANGQEIKTEVIKDVGQQSAAPAPAQLQPQAPPAEAKPTPPPAPMPEMPAGAKPTPPPAPKAESPAPKAEPPAPKAEQPIEAKNSTTAAEPVKSTLTAQVSQNAVAGVNATVSTIHHYVSTRSATNV